MKTHSVQLFVDPTDDDPAEEWAVIASTPEEARRLLREHFGDTWRLWGKSEVAISERQVPGPAGVIGRIPPG